MQHEITPRLHAGLNRPRVVGENEHIDEILLGVRLLVLGVDGERLGSQQILQDPCILVRTSPEQLLGHDEHLAAEHRVEVAKQRIRSTLAREALATEDPTHEV